MVGLNGSSQLAMKFADADAFGFQCGKRNRITLIDVDSRDEGVVREAMADTARSAWGYEVRGENLKGRGRAVVIPHNVIDALDAHPDSLCLYTKLRRHHWAGTLLWPMAWPHRCGGALEGGSAPATFSSGSGSSYVCTRAGKDPETPDLRLGL
jgi:hypothetical protein